MYYSVTQIHLIDRCLLYCLHQAEGNNDPPGGNTLTTAFLTESRQLMHVRKIYGRLLQGFNANWLCYELVAP